VAAAQPYRRVVVHGLKTIALINGAFAAWGVVLMVTTSFQPGLVMCAAALGLALLDASFNTATRIEVAPGSVALNAWLSGKSYEAHTLTVRRSANGRRFTLAHNDRPRRALATFRGAEVADVLDALASSGVSVTRATR
jgi:hypothetical protein